MKISSPPPDNIKQREKNPLSLHIHLQRKHIKIRQYIERGYCFVFNLKTDKRFFFLIVTIIWLLVRSELIAICRVTMVTSILLLSPLILLRLTVNPKGSLAAIQK